MFCRGIDGLLGCGADLFALFCFRPLYLGLRVELGPRFRSGSVLLGSLLSRALLSGLLLSHLVLHGCCLGVHRNPLLGAVDPGVRCFGTGLRRLGIGNGFDAVRLLALLGLGLLELSLGGPLMSYRDSDGTWRHGLKGESVDIAADDLERFDKLNFGNNYTNRRSRSSQPRRPRRPRSGPETTAAWRAWVSSPLSQARCDSGTTPARPPLSPGGCGGGAPQRVGSAPTLRLLLPLLAGCAAVGGDRRRLGLGHPGAVVAVDGRNSHDDRITGQHREGRRQQPVQR